MIGTAVGLMIGLYHSMYLDAELNRSTKVT